MKRRGGGEGIDNVNVMSILDIQSYLNTKNVGDIVQLKVIRDKQNIEISVTLGHLMIYLQRIMTIFQVNNSYLHHHHHHHSRCRHQENQIPLVTISMTCMIGVQRLLAEVYVIHYLEDR